MLGLERFLQSNDYPASEIILTATYLLIRPASFTCWLLLACPFPLLSIFLHFPIDFLFADFTFYHILLQPLQGAPGQEAELPGLQLQRTVVAFVRDAVRPHLEHQRAHGRVLRKHRGAEAGLSGTSGQRYFPASFLRRCFLLTGMGARILPSIW